MPNVVLCSPVAALRIERAMAWLARCARDEQLVIAGASIEAVNDLTRVFLRRRGGAAFGWHRVTLGRLAASLALQGLAQRGLVPVGTLPLEALCARVVEELARKGDLGRFQAVADRPGLPRALARTIQDVRMAGVELPALAAHEPDLARIERAYEDELKRAGLADRAIVLQAAAAVARDPKAVHPMLGAPLLLLDSPVAGALERDLVAALAARAPDALATVPAGDDRSLQNIKRALAVEPEFVGHGTAAGKGREGAEAQPAPPQIRGLRLQPVPAPGPSGSLSDAVVQAPGGAPRTTRAAGSKGGAARSPAPGAQASASAALSFAATGPLWARPVVVPIPVPAQTSLLVESTPPPSSAVVPATPHAQAAASAAETAETLASEAAASMSSLERLQTYLFSDAPAPRGKLGDDVVILSAPGESRECVEIARLLRMEAARGVPFDKMAVLLRAPTQYRTHIQEALRRAGIPAHFAQGTVRPDPSGRAFLALLACAAEKLSARRFSEYLSLGEVPDATPAGSPPPPLPASARFIPPDDELLPESLAQQTPELFDEPLLDTSVLPPDPEAAPVAGGTLRTPRHWEQLLVDAAVIGGRDRWAQRLDGLERELRLDLAALEDPDDPTAARIHRNLAGLASLRSFALPLLDDLATLPERAPWGTWIDRLSALATRGLRTPERILSILATLAPMASVGPVDLREVRIVLQRRLTELVALPAARKFGRVFVAPVEAARGLAFDVVFIPGLAEKIFPQKLVEDPILRDLDRRRVCGDRGGPGSSPFGCALETNEDRVAKERLALRLAVGAARSRVVLSYPRVDMDQSRPRVPSFYGLEVLRAAEGRLPGFDELAKLAADVASARIGWPAPEEPAKAIDEAEHDLALLNPLFRQPEESNIGTARYLLNANPHLARALRFRARRWIPSWTSSDGLAKPIPEAQAVLALHALSARSYSPTALQMYASCPYRFFLHAVHRLAPRKPPDAIEEMDPLQRGSLVHEAQFEALAHLRDAGLLPVTSDNLEEARGCIDTILSRVAQRFHDELAPAIPRVWDDTIAQIRADMREWLRRAAEDPSERDWVPWRFELSFGLTDRRAKDPGSQDEPAPLDCGIKLRGSIDLVEKHRTTGALRATDYKTGKIRASKGAVVGGGETLQPVLYALALEKIFPDMRVEIGRLYYCTSAGSFEPIPIRLDDRARESAREVAAIVGEALQTGFLPAAPDKGACQFCDYQNVCGPYEEMRAARKRQDALVRLKRLRSMP